MDFCITPQSSQSAITDAVNYLLANLGSNSAQYNSQTGQITQNGVVIGYLYKYLWVKYATSFDGTTGFSDSPTNATYYGIHNSNSSIESSNPDNYVWTPFSFSTNFFFYYLVTGGRKVTISINPSIPGSGWVKDTGPVIDLDAVVSQSTNGLLAFNGGQTVNSTVSSTVTYTSNGITLPSQIANSGSVWRIAANGSFVAVNSATARNAQVAAYWGTTQLPVISIPVLINTAQTTNWQLELLLTGSSTTGIWTAGYLRNNIASASAVVQTQLTAASTSVTAGALTLDLRFAMSVVVASDQWVINAVTLERLK